MSISILNYDDSEVVRTPVVAIKGTFDLDCDCLSNCDIKLTATAHCVQNVEDPQNSSSTRNYSTRIVENEFVILTELFVGLNNLSIEVRHSCNLPDQNNLETRLDLIYEPNTNDIFVQPLVVYCTEHADQLISPNPPSERNVKQFTLALQLVQTYFSDQLFEHGMKRKSFTCANTPISFALLMSPEKMKELNTNQVWSMLAKELMMRPGIWNEKCKYVAFIDSPEDSNIEAGTSAKACAKSFELGGLAVIPMSFTAIWPETIRQVFPLCADSTIEKVYSQTIGCLAHEIGHTFDLGHTKNGLMGCNYMDFTLSLCPPVSVSSSNRSDQRVYNFDGKKTSQLARLGKISAELLFYHRGFLPSPRLEDKAKSKLEFINNIIYSSAGIAVVDLRDEDGFIFNEWSFLTGVKVWKFPITKKEIPPLYQQKQVELFVEDLKGNSLKKQLDLNSLPLTSFTKLQR